MRRSFRGKQQVTKSTKDFLINEKIAATELMVIDENGEQLGVMAKSRALQEAVSRGYDLVEVSPKAVPPIGKFMDYGSFKYQRDKQEKKQKAKSKATEVKTVKVSTRIGQHDIDIRAEKAAEFLSDGDKVRIELLLRGREHQHVDVAKETVQKTIDVIASRLEGKQVKKEQEILKVGSKISAIITL